MDISLEDSLQVELGDLSLESAGEARVHGGAAREHNVLVELRPDVHVGRLDRVEEQLGDAHTLAVGQVRLKEDLWRLEALAA